jgi:hypothetical protein
LVKRLLKNLPNEKQFACQVSAFMHRDGALKVIQEYLGTPPHQNSARKRAKTTTGVFAPIQGRNSHQHRATPPANLSKRPERPLQVPSRPILCGARIVDDRRWAD